MMKSGPDTKAQKNLVIITGLSGSGMSSATNAFEDLGYFCVDNLPITMLSTFSRLLQPNDQDVVAIERAALVINIRERHFLAEFPAELKKLSKKKLDPVVVFFEASDEVLQRRFSETRRPHPADTGKGLLPSIRSERKAMDDIRRSADLIIDTSEHTVHTLRRLIVEKFGRRSAKDTRFKVVIVSFGHKFGNPRDLDLLFDVRHLPNPYFEPSLKDFTGEHPKIKRFLAKHEEVARNDLAFYRCVEVFAAVLQARREVVPDDRNRMHRRQASLGDGRKSTPRRTEEREVQRFSSASRYAKIAF